MNTNILANPMIRFSISLPDWYERKLRLWAALKGVSRAALASNILQARIEANWDEIQRDMEAIAKLYGITVEELESRWLKEEGDRPEE